MGDLTDDEIAVNLAYQDGAQNTGWILFHWKEVSFPSSGV